MKRYLIPPVALLLAACSTQQVHDNCVEAEQICRLVKPALDFTPSSVQLAAGGLCGGAYACGTPEYAAAREQVIAWLRSRRVRI